MYGHDSLFDPPVESLFPPGLPEMGPGSGICSRGRFSLLSRYERVQLISAYQRQVSHYQALFYGEIARLYAQELSEGPRGRGRGLGLGGPHRARGGRPVSATWSPSVVVITVAGIGSGGGIHPSPGVIISGSRRSDTATPPVAGRSRLEPWEDMSSRTLKR